MVEADAGLVIVVGTAPGRCERLAALAAREGWQVKTAAGAEVAAAMLEPGEADGKAAVVLNDAGRGEGIPALIRQLKALRPQVPVVVLTDRASTSLAIEAMRAGATDYLIKPVAPERLLQAVLAATATACHGEELQPLTEKIGPSANFEAMVGSAPRFRAALAIAAKAARTQATVLIEGESGTGKEMLVRAMHAASPRAKHGLHLVNLASFAPGQLESVLFGHERGAFPGAFDRQRGFLETAEGGTLVLDEVDRLPLTVQGQLAEFLTNGIIQPVGARHRLRIDVRLFACSNVPAAELRDQGRLRPELARLLSSALISLPPLRERTGDIPALTRHLLAAISEQPGLRPLGITDRALALLASYHWPGNVRQLQAVLFRAAVFCDGDALTEQDFPNLSDLVGETAPAAAPVESGGVTLYAGDGNLRRLEDIEADVIRLAIGHYRGQMSEVARRLGIGRSTLYRKLVVLGLDNAA